VFAVLFILGLSDAALAQLICSLASTPISRDTDTGLTEPAGDITFNCTQGSVGTTSAIITIAFGVPIMDNTVYPPPAGTGGPVRITNATGTFTSGQVPTISSVINALGSVVVSVPPQAGTANTGPRSGSFTLSGVLVAFSGSGKASLSANVSVSPGNNVLITAGQSVATVVTSVLPGIANPRLTPGTTAGTVSTGGTVVAGGFSVAVPENYIDMYRSKAQFNGGASTQGVRLLFAFAGIPPGVTLSGCSASLAAAGGATGAASLSATSITPTNNTLTVDFTGTVNLTTIDTLTVACSTWTQGTATLPYAPGAVTMTATLAPTGPPCGVVCIIGNGQIPSYLSNPLPSPPLTVINILQTVLAQTTVTANPTGLQIIVDGITLTAPQSFSWVPGSNHTIGVPSPQGAGTTRSAFTSWNDGGAQSHTITVSPTTGAPLVLIATFRMQYLLTTTVSPPGSGTVTATPSSDDSFYDNGSIVQLLAASTTRFLNWSGALSGSVNPQAVVMGGPRSVTANFAPLTTITTNPPGLQIAVDGISLIAPQGFTWTPGSNHTIGVTSPQGTGEGRYVFTSWSDEGSQTHNVVAAASANSYTANFKVQYLLTTAVSPPGSGSIVVSPTSQDSFYDTGTSVQLTAVGPFQSWSGALSGSANPASLVMSASRSVTANFTNTTPLTITTPSPLPNGMEAVSYSVTLTARGGSGVYTWSLPQGSQLPQGLTLNSNVISGRPTTRGTSTFTLRVTDSAGGQASGPFSITIDPLPSLPGFTYVLPDTLNPTQQQPVEVMLTSPYPLPISVQLTITFAPNAINNSDSDAVFTNGTKALGFTIPAMQTDFLPSVAVQAGTVAGTITVTATLQVADRDVTPNPPPIHGMNVNQLAPSLTDDVRIVPTTSGFEVQITGFSTIRDVRQAIFQFKPANSGNLKTLELTIDVESAFGTWYRSPDSTPGGGTFHYVQPFTVSGDIKDIDSVSITLANGRGNSETRIGKF
jgi:hypothetical protein